MGYVGHSFLIRPTFPTVVAGQEDSTARRLLRNEPAEKSSDEIGRRHYSSYSCRSGAPHLLPPAIRNGCTTTWRPHTPPIWALVRCDRRGPGRRSRGIPGGTRQDSPYVYTDDTSPTWSSSGCTVSSRTKETM